MKAVVLLSGGLDSSTLLYEAIAGGHEVLALSLHYGQRHARELEAAAKVATLAGVEHKQVNLLPLLDVFAGADSSQVGNYVPVPTGHYADESMKRTIVPNRNMILLSIAAAFAISNNAKLVGYAAHAGDHPIYPDCRPEFAESFNKTVELATGGLVSL